jgi:acyl-coenzyme A synthetase/AMP-(fatty) acid ligase
MVATDCPQWLAGLWYSCLTQIIQGLYFLLWRPDSLPERVIFAIIRSYQNRATFNQCKTSYLNAGITK